MFGDWQFFNVSSFQTEFAAWMQQLVSFNGGVPGLLTGFVLLMFALMVVDSILGAVRRSTGLWLPNRADQSTASNENSAQTSWRGD